MSGISQVDLNLAMYSIYNKETQAFEDVTVTGNLYTVAEVTEDDGITPRKLSMAELVMVICLARAAEKERAIIDLMSEMSDTTQALNILTEIETKLLDGLPLSDIRGNWKYKEKNFTRADRFLGELGIVPIDANRAMNLDSIQGVANKLASGESAFSGGSYYWDGWYKNPFGILAEAGCLNGTHNGKSVSDAYDNAVMLTFYGDVPLSDAQKEMLTDFGMPAEVLEMTTYEASRALENEYYNGFVKDKIQDVILNYPIVNGGIDIDQLITDIESKMDSMNSFSQQKMIELQSDTNKRDQAYDMITNILKSMNTVQVGIVNNM